MSKVVTVVGARPQFVKAGPVSRALASAGHAEVLVHTGQHYDPNMSAIFFDELGLPAPAHHLGVGSGSHAAQTGAMLERVERVIDGERPDWVLVYGDTNSTLAAALAAAKLHVPVAHVEAGLRSFNRRMPEEVNRVLVDHVSALLLVPGQRAVDNLAAEGLTRGVHVIGDVMVDALEAALARAAGRSTVLARLGLAERRYVLLTLHRQENTDDRARLTSIMSALRRLGETVVFPVHPRTRKALAACAGEAAEADNLVMIDPVGYLDMVSLEQSARLILTDSGGVQKEAYWLGVPCVTLRDETEWTETVDCGWNRLAGVDADRIESAVRGFAPPAARPPLYGDGHAAGRVAALL
jgi:UDP-N-acetylglucosamine 2-epimerase